MPANTSAIYLILGGDQGRKEREIATIRRALARQGSLAVQSYWADECPIEQLLAIVRNPPLFETHALILYHNIDTLHGSTAHAQLKSYISRPNPHTILILTSELNSLSYAWVKKIPNSARIVCWQPFQNAIINEVRTIFQQHSLEIETTLIEQFILSLENDSAVVRTSSEQLASYCAAAGKVSQEIIEDFFSFGHSETVFTLINECLARNTSRALRVFFSLIYAGIESALIIHMLYRTFHHLLFFLSSPSEDFDAICRTRGIVWRGQQQKYRAALKKFSHQECIVLLSRLAKTEVYLRQGPAPLIPHFFARLIVNVCEGAAPPLAPRWLPELSRAQVDANP